MAMLLLAIVGFASMRTSTGHYIAVSFCWTFRLCCARSTGGVIETLPCRGMACSGALRSAVGSLPVGLIASASSTSYISFVDSDICPKRLLTALLGVVL